MYFEIAGEIENIETISIGSAIVELGWLRRQSGPGRWRKLKGEARVRLPNGRVRSAEVHWYEAHGIGRRKLKVKRLLRLSDMPPTRRTPQFALCIRNDGCEDLETRKVYQVLPDEEAAREGLLRVVDESGEDYLYPAACFVAIELPQGARKALVAAG
jgi:hypothetical protein